MGRVQCPQPAAAFVLIQLPSCGALAAAAPHPLSALLWPADSAVLGPDGSFPLYPWQVQSRLYERTQLALPICDCDERSRGAAWCPPVLTASWLPHCRGGGFLLALQTQMHADACNVHYFRIFLHVSLWLGSSKRFHLTKHHMSKYSVLSEEWTVIGWRQ